MAHGKRKREVETAPECPFWCGDAMAAARRLGTSRLGGELRGTGVVTTTLCPGPVDTGFGETAGFAKEDADAALPKFMWESAEALAKCGIEGLDKSRPVAIPGAANRVSAMFAHMAPKRLLVPILASRHPGLKS